MGFVNQDQRIPKSEACPDCLRPLTLCFCGKTKAFPTKLRVLILQHPAEKLKLWNSAMLAHKTLENSALRVGLSWPNLRKAAGVEIAEPGKWGVLFLKGKHRLEKPLNLFNRKEAPLEDASFLQGIVALDGSWKQAQALWWRNPWLLRLNRIALRPEEKSRRGQAKAAGMATIESIAQTLRLLGEESAVSEGLLRQYEELVVGPLSVSPLPRYVSPLPPEGG